MITALMREGGTWLYTNTSFTGCFILGCSAIVPISIAYFILQFKKPVRVTKPPREFSKDGPDVIIIGSGVAGSAMATVLARDGRKVTVIERDLKEPDRIVGELLQPGGVRALKKLGLEECIQGLDAHQIKGYVLHNKETNAELIVPYPKGEGSDSITEGTAFHHGRFIMALRSKAWKEPNVTCIEATANKLIEENGVVVGVQYRCKNEEESKSVYAPLTLVVDGCFSKFRKELVTETPRVTSHFVGLLLKHCPQKQANHAELVLSEPSPVLVYQISSDSTRVLVDVRGLMPKNIKEHLLENVLYQLPEHIQEPFRESVETGRVRSMPNSFLPPSPMERPGVLVLGDAFNMRHPLTGGGMSVCLNDTVLWRDLFRGIPDLTDYESIIKALRLFHLKRKNSHSFVVNVLANALYELFAADGQHTASMKRACFEYFKLGGECVSGPVSLLSVLNPKPHVLIGHFFAVALYAVYFVYQSEPIWALHRVFYRSLMIIFSACGILFPLIWSEIRSLIFK